MDRIKRRLESQGTKVPPERTLAPQVLERLIISRIQLQRAERVGIQVSDETLNSALANVAQRNNVTIDQLPADARPRGPRLPGLPPRACATRSPIEQLRQRDVLSRISVTPKEVDEYLARQAGRAAFNMEYNLSQILVAVSPTATPDTIAAAEKKITEHR